MGLTLFRRFGSAADDLWLRATPSFRGFMNTPRTYGVRIAKTF